MPTVEISDASFQRLQKAATPLVDTIDTVINRLLDSYERQAGLVPAKRGEPIKVVGDTMHFDPHNPPPLGFTTLTNVFVDGVQLPKGETYWNKVLNRVVVEAAKRGHNADAILNMLFVNASAGERDDNGYKFIPEAGISVQGQDSNAAFRQAFELAEQLGVSLKVHFYWQDNEKSAFANQRAVIEI